MTFLKGFLNGIYILRRFYHLIVIITDKVKNQPKKFKICQLKFKYADKGNLSRNS